jgi:asparagine synthase (glutamine-hydrolysing)
MSGFAALANANGRPIDRELPEAMARLLKRRGPQAQHIWMPGGPLALIHSLFQTDDGNCAPVQPLSWDGITWIVADARIDARDELRDRLRGQGRVVHPSNDDAELILHAWHAWGGACVEHLLGDFSFVILDTSHQRLFAARDQLGVKPLYYACVGEGIVISNDLDCTRVHPEVTETLDDSWVCDFLLFGWNTDVTATVWKNVRRLPPGHRLEWTPSALKVERYWSVSIPDEVVLWHPEEYIERFNAVFGEAVADRLRAKRVAIAMSGGLDSTAIAATAVDWASKNAASTDFRALSCVWDPLLPNDRERAFAQEAAHFLEIPITFIEGPEHGFFDEAWNSSGTQRPEPTQRGCRILETLCHVASRHSGVLLSGLGGDEALKQPAGYYARLLHERRYASFMADVVRHFRYHGRLPPVGLRTAIRPLVNRPSPASAVLQFPAWIAKDLVQQFDLLDKWQEFWHIAPRDSRTPGGYGAIAGYLNACSLDLADGEALHGPVNYRFPWLDLRVLQFCWAMPPAPLRFSKQVLRQAMRRRLPSAVVRRQKTGLQGDPLTVWVGKALKIGWMPPFPSHPSCARYVVKNPLEELRQSSCSSHAIWLHTRPLELSSWLCHRVTIPSKPQAANTRVKEVDGGSTARPK